MFNKLIASIYILLFAQLVWANDPKVILNSTLDEEVEFDVNAFRGNIYCKDYSRRIKAKETLNCQLTRNEQVNNNIITDIELIFSSGCNAKLVVYKNDTHTVHSLAENGCTVKNENKKDRNIYLTISPK